MESINVNDIIVLEHKFKAPSELIYQYFEDHPDEKDGVFDLVLVKGLIKSRFVKVEAGKKLQLNESYHYIPQNHPMYTDGTIEQINKNILSNYNVDQYLTQNEIDELKVNS